MRGRSSLGNIPMPFGLPMQMPGPGSPGVPSPGLGPAQPAGLFPTNLRTGDVMSVTGPFAGYMQGQVVVYFAGHGGGVAVALRGPYGGSVVVPPDAETGSCTIEVDGRTVYGTNCVIARAGTAPAPEHRDFKAWKRFGNLEGFTSEPSKLLLVAAAAYILWRLVK